MHSVIYKVIELDSHANHRPSGKNISMYCSEFLCLNLYFWVETCSINLFCSRRFYFHDDVTQTMYLFWITHIIRLCVKWPLLGTHISGYFTNGKCFVLSCQISGTQNKNCYLIENTDTVSLDFLQGVTVWSLNGFSPNVLKCQDIIHPVQCDAKHNACVFY